MKKSKLWLLVALVLVVVCIFAVSCKEDDEVTHAAHGGLTDITIITEPTEETEGKVTATCACGEFLEIPVPALNDTKFWQVSVEDATCGEEGARVYTSIKYEQIVYTVTIPTLDHTTYGAWSITTEPTDTTTGEAKRTCTCGHVENATLPVLTDTTFWTVVIDPEADHLNTGLATYTSVYGRVEVVLETKPHDGWSNWTIKTEPTKTETGVAERTCTCGHSEPVTLPVLTDASFWTAEITPPQHEVEGSEVYTSVYGTVTITLDAEEHEWAWTITTAPTKANGGEASATCSCGDTDTKALPALTDTAFWTVAVTEADYNKAGAEVYTSAYGEVTIVLDKLVAPYDGKFYYAVEMGDTGDNNKAMGSYIWNSACFEIGADGTGYSHGYPLQGYTVITMVDYATGKVLITSYRTTYPSDTDDDGIVDTELVVDMSEKTTEHEAYLDVETGVMIFKKNQGWDCFIVMVPAENEIARDDVAASIWSADKIAATWTADGETNGFFISGETITWGTTFVSAAGETVAADECYNAPYVFVKKGEDVVASFGYYNDEMNELDAYYGTYINGEETVTASGYGTLVFNNGVVTLNGIYTIAPVGSAYDLDVYMLSESGAKIMYLQIAIADDNTYTKVQPMVDVNFNGGAYAGNSTQNVNQNVAITLPTLTASDESKLFLGWATTNGATEVEYAAGEAFIPTEETELYAVWGERCVVTLTGVKDGDPTTVYMGTGENILSKLPAYETLEIDTANNKYFVGWYALVEGEEIEIEEEMMLDEGLTELAIIAKWEDVPAYYGTYNGGNLYSTSNGSGGTVFNIDLFGNITGAKSGKMSDFNAEDNTIVLSDGKTYHFDIEAGVFVTPYSTSNTYVTDAHVFVRDAETMAGKHFGFYKEGETGKLAYRLIMFTVNDTNRAILIHAEGVYNNVTVTDALGQTISSIAEATASKTLVITTEDGVEIFAGASTAATFSSSNKSTVLDAARGVYTLAGTDATVILDGCGNLSYNGMIGTYTENGTAYDVYLADGTEYYTMTIDTEAKTYTIEKTMVDVTFNTNQADMTEPAVNVNKNIAITLPTLEKAGYTFRGWYAEGAEDTILTGSYIPTASVTLYAKWDASHTFTAHYNDGTTVDMVEVYGEGDIITILQPTRSGYRFMGWYTTESLDAGTEWTNGTAMGTADVEIWAKWGEPFAGNGTYSGNELESETTVSGTPYTITIDEEGNVTGKFTGTLTTWDPVTKLGTLKKDGTGDRVVYFDPDAGILVAAYASGTTPYFSHDAYVFVMSDTVAPSISTYGIKGIGVWRIGFRLVTYTIGETTYNHLLTLDNVYTNVTVCDAFGNALAVDTLANAKTAVFKQGETIVASVAAQNTSFAGAASTVAMDNTFGIYTLAGSDVVVKLDGAGTIIYGDATGTYTANGTAYDVYLTDGTEYYTMTIDIDAKTYTIEKPMVDITFNTNQADMTEPAVNVNKNIAITLPTLEKTGFVFRGWYAEGAEDTILTGEYVPTANIALHAKWDRVITLTIQLGNGMDDIVETFGEGDDITAFLQENAPVGAVNGKAFSKWTVNGETYTGGIITDSMIVVCVWADAVDEMGDYKSFEVWGSSGSGNKSGPKNNLVVDAMGKTTGFKTGSIVYDESGKAIGFTVGSTTYFAVYAKGGEYDVFAWAFSGSNPTSLGTDMYIGIKGVDTLAWVGQSVFNSGKTRVVEMTADGTNVIIFVHNDMVYANVTVSTLDGTPVTAANAGSETALVIKDHTDSIIATLVNKGNNVWEGLDGTEGTYTGELGEIVSSGAGTITIGDTTVEYIFADGKLSFNYNNQYRVATLADGAYTLVADGIAGTYTLPDSSTYVLDGFGVVTGVGTYTIDGTNITVYVTGGENTTYGLDVEGKTLAGKSVFAGLTFTGTYYNEWDGYDTELRVIFDDSSAISGIMYSGYSTTYYFHFTGVLEGNTLTLTITKAIDSGSVGKTVVFTIEGDTMTVTSTTMTSNVYTFSNDGSVKCDGFSL